MGYDLIIIVRAYNEEKCIQDFLDHCKRISDGVVILDDHSTDNTLSIAKKHPSVLYAFKSFSRISHEGVDWNSLLTAVGFFQPKWVLLLDVDERLEEYRFLKYKDKMLSANDVSSYSFLWPFINSDNMCNYSRDDKALPRKKSTLLKYDQIIGCRYPLTREAHHIKPDMMVRNVKFLITNIRLKHFVETKTIKEIYEKFQFRLHALKKFNVDDHATVELVESWGKKLKAFGPDKIYNTNYHLKYQHKWNDNELLELKLQTKSNCEILQGMFNV